MSLYEIRNFSKKIKILLFNSPLLLILVSFLSQPVSSQGIYSNMTEVDLFVKALNDFNETKFYLEDLTKKMETITLNIGLRIRFRQIKRLFKDIEKKVTYIKGEINKDIYNKEIIINEIESLNIYMNKFKNKYIRTNQLYYEFEELKTNSLHFLKLFFIILFICVIIILIIIGISSFLVVKSQKRKYYKLKEEHSYTSEKRDIIINNNNIIDKNYGQNNSGDKNIINDKINTNKKNLNFVVSQKTGDNLKEPNNEIIREQIIENENKSTSKGELEKRK